MLEMFDYELLRVIWWFLLGILLIGFAVMDGFDLGVATLLPFVAKTDGERRVVLNSVGPVWDGNQVWFILGGGAIFAAWPTIYAVSFSGFYFAMLLVLLALILRPVGFDYRSKIDNKNWRLVWDWCLFISGFVPSLVFGVAIGNVLQGVPFGFNEFMVVDNQIGFLNLFSPFSVLCGVLSVFMLTTHGASYLAMKTEGQILSRSLTVLRVFPFVTITLFALGAVFLLKMNGYYVDPATIDTLADSNPLGKEVSIIVGGWYGNYEKYNWMIVAPIMGFLGAMLTFIFVVKKQFGKAFIASASSIFGIVSTVGLTMFPFILPSSLNPKFSLLVWDSSSSYLALFVMLVAVIIFFPLVLFYTSYIYNLLRGKVREEDIQGNDKFLY